MSAALLLAAESDGPGWLLLLGPAGGGGLYWGLWRYYRNTHRSHAFEHETRVAAQSITGTDVKFDEITGTKQSKIDNGNHDDHRQRVQRLP